MASAHDEPTAGGTAPTATETVTPAPPPPAPPPPALPEPALPEPAPSAVADGDADQTPFWMPWHPHWPVFPARSPRRPAPRRPAFGVAALVVLGLVAAFIAWVSAEPLWLTMGHGDRGTATATQCSADGSPYECVVFTADGGRYVAEDVTLLGTEHGQLRQGSRLPAEMVSRDSGRAYVADVTGLRVRSAAGLVVLLLCGLGIAWATGATRLDPPGTRRAAFLACLAAPLLLTLGFLAATF